MTRSLHAVLLAVLSFTFSLGAQPSFRGEPFPLTNTRYDATAGFPRLVSNGREQFLFWSTTTHFHFTRLGWGTAPPSRAIMENTGLDSWDVVWTGTHFLFVAGQRSFTSSVLDDRIVAQRIDPSGELAGEPFVLLEGGEFPRVAFDGTSVLMLSYVREQYFGTHVAQIYSMRLQPDGTPIAAEAKATGVTGLVEGLASNGRSFAAVVSHSFERQVVMFDRNGELLATQPLVTDFTGVGSIAAGGDRYLIADAAGPSVHTRLLAADGTLGPALEVEPLRGGSSFAAVSWTGSKWAVAHTTPWSDTPSFAVDIIDADNRAVESHEEQAGTSPSLTAAGGRVSVAWQPLGSPGIIHHDELPLSGSAGTPVSFAATEQTLRATASAAHGTLAVWSEAGALYAGVRSRDGSWTEQKIRSGPAFNAFAASDGDGFAIAWSEPTQWTVLRLDRQARPIGQPVAITNMGPSDLLWTGRAYALTGVQGNDDVAVTLDANGMLSAPVKIPSTTLAANGNGFFAVWLLEAPFQTPPLPPLGVEGIRLGLDFRPLDAMPTRFVLDQSAGVYSCDVAWDGAQYVVAWSGDRGVFAANAPAGGAIPVARTIDTGFNGLVTLTPITNGVAAKWTHREKYTDEVSSLRATFLLRDGTATPFVTIASNLRVFDESIQPIRLAALQGGDVAIVRTAVQNDAPAEGSLRLTMSILSAAALPQRPQKPAVTAATRGDVVDVRWSAVPQPVSGWRVEYRIEDQPWIEIERVLAAGELSVTVPNRGKRTVFRVRAWNEAGSGEYSSPAIVNAVKRRAVR